MTRAMFEKQKQAPSNTELKIYPDRSHWTCIEAGWAQVGRCQLVARADVRLLGLNV